jgi:hypothetical protein
MNSTIVGLIAAIAVLSGGLGLSLTEVFDDQKLMTSNAGSTGFLVGQVIVEARNSDGEIFAYRQSDNEVVDDGEQCILKMLFATNIFGDEATAAEKGRGEYTNTATNGGSPVDAEYTTSLTHDAACTGTLTGAWDVIAIGEGTVGGTAVVVDDNAVGLGIEITDRGLARTDASTKTWNNGSGGGISGACANTACTKIVLKHTFTSTGSATVTESGLFNSTLNGSPAALHNGMLAVQTFTGIALTTDDSITIQWTFTVGN